MPPGSKSRADMSLRHILNPVEDDKRSQPSRLIVDWQRGQDQDSLEYSNGATHDTLGGSIPKTHPTEIDSEDFKNDGCVENHQFEQQSRFTETRNALHRQTGEHRDNRYTEEPIAKAKRPRINSGTPNITAKGPQSPNTSWRRRLVLSGSEGMSDNEMECEDTPSEVFASNENTQQSNSSCPPSHQESLQTTQSSPYKAVSECRYSSSPEPVLRDGGSAPTLNAQTAHVSGNARIMSRSQRPRKRQRATTSPESGEEAVPSQRKTVESFNLEHNSDDPYNARPVGAEYHSHRSTLARQPRCKTKSRVLPKKGRPSVSLVRSPTRSYLYTRRNSSSPVHRPILNIPRGRDQRICCDLSPQAPSPEVSSQNFNLFTAILAHPELTLEVSKHLDVQTLVALYATSKDYHNLVDNRFTALIMGQAISKASESARVFSFRAYRNLCKRDPIGKIMLFSVSEKDGTERVATAKDNDVRFVPSFRWLKMVLHHEAVVDCILQCLAQEGHRLPRCTTLVLKKLWFMLNITDNGRRIAVLHDMRFWSNKDLFIVTMFFVKLDMRLTDPITGTGEMGMRKLLLAQKGLETLARVLARDEAKSQLELLRLIVRYDYTPPRPLRKGETVFGVPADEVGKLCYEGWGKGDKKLVPIDELIAREAVRRRLNLQDHYVDMMLYGYINKRMFEDIKTPMALLPTALNSKDDGDTENNSSETEGEIQQEASWSRRRRMGLFESETDVGDQEVGDEQEEDISLDGQGFDI